MIWGMLQTCGVDIFLMISGALLLKKDDTWKYNIKHRVVRIITALLLAEIINFFWQIKGDISKFDVGFIIERIISKPLVSSHWYIYMYIGFLLMLPIFQKFVRNLESVDFEYMFGLYFVLYCVDAVLWFKTNGEMKYYGGNYQGLCTVQNMFVPLMGYYCDRFFKMEKRNIIKCNIACTALVLIQCIMVEYTCITMKEWSKTTAEIWFGYFVVPMSMIIFIDIKYFFEENRMNCNLKKIITTAGTCSFGVYLFEEILRNITGRIFDVCHMFLPVLVSTWIWILILMMLGLIMIWIIRLVPVFRKIL